MVEQRQMRAQHVALGREVGTAKAVEIGEVGLPDKCRNDYGGASIQVVSR